MLAGDVNFREAFRSIAQRRAMGEFPLARRCVGTLLAVVSGASVVPYPKRVHYARALRTTRRDKIWLNLKHKRGTESGCKCIRGSRRSGDKRRW